LVLALGLAAVWLVVIRPLSHERTRFPTEGFDEARAALRAARDHEARVYAPLLWERADSVFSRSRLEGARVSARFPSFRDYGETAHGFAAARRFAEEAGAEAVRARDAARSRAQGALLDARRAVDLAARSHRVTRSGRPHLTRARVQLREAETHLREGRPAAVLGKAEEAIRTARSVAEEARATTARFADLETVERWQRWVEETVEESRRAARPALLVVKERNELILLENGTETLRCPADMGSNRLHSKQRAGDRATPEGRYRIAAKKGPGQTRYHRALLLDYPSPEDLRKSKNPGGAIEIHGQGGTGSDWTLGCIALTDAAMDRLFDRVSVGTPVTIVGGLGSGGVFSDLHRSLREHGGSSP
jgi:L,D-peptidoglycan transpeptidase YkuD (ErfK/YbiS/YcfS/YnhG family)